LQDRIDLHLVDIILQVAPLALQRGIKLRAGSQSAAA
jgi:hypothetical protein